MLCYHCDKESRREIRGLPICDSCYILAVEHGADIELPLFDESVAHEMVERRRIQRKNGRAAAERRRVRNKMRELNKWV